MNFLLNSQPANAVPDRRQAGHSVLDRHLYCSEVADDRLEDRQRDVGLVLPRVLQLDALSQLFQRRVNESVKILKNEL